MTTTNKVAELLAEVKDLRQRLAEAEETILAIRHGGVDAFVMRGPNGDHVYTLAGADRPYRLVIEHMPQGAATLRPDGVILYCNQRLAEYLAADPAKLTGSALTEFVPADQVAVCQELLHKGALGASRGACVLLSADGRRVPVSFAINALPLDDQPLLLLLVTELSEHHTRQDPAHLADCLTRLQAFAAARSEAWTVEQVADAIIANGLDAVGANAGALALLSDDGRQVRVLRMHGLPAEFAERTRTLPLESSWMLTDTIRTRQMLVLPSWEERCARYPGHRDAHMPGGDGAAVAVPLLFKDRCIGALGLTFPEDRAFSTDELQFMRAFAGECTLALERGRLYDAEREAHQQLEEEYHKRLHAEEALRQSEQRYRAFIQQTSEAIWRFEFEQPIPIDLPVDEQLDRAFRLGYLAECNDAMARMYGFETAEQLVGMRLPDLVVTSDAGNLRRLRAFMEAAYRLNDVESLERDRDGNLRIFLNNIVGTVVEGKLVRAWGTQRDVTERRRAEEALRQSEEQFRLLAESIPQLAWMARPDGHIYWYNQRWYQYTGATPEQMEGWGWQSVHDPEALPNVLERWKASLATGTPFEMVFPLRGADGEYRRFLTRVVPLRDKEGNILHWFGTNTDIEVQKRAEETLQEADRRKDDFLAMLAHELRNPLGPIRNAVHILNLVGSQEPTSRNARAMIERQVAHMARLIDDLLDVSRISRGKVLLREERCELTEIVRTTTEDYRGILEATGLRVHVELPSGPLWVQGDSTRLSQVVGNLLHNANKFTDAGGQVHVRLTRDPSGRSVSIVIRDTGIGMEPDMLRRVFEAFSQADRSIDRSRGGLGLGLALVKGLVELHGGHVTARSEGIGKGSEFTITLPLGEAPMLLTDSELGRPATAQRVLLVEDHPDAAESMKVLLALAGYQVETAGNGLAALELADAFRPQVIVCDITLPGGMDGYEIARSLRLDPTRRDTFLIALTGYGQDDDQRRAREAGFDWHMTKPIDFNELHEVLTAVASRP